ncbi:MAG: phosphomannomutase/phosphoglucomutase [Planctomycetota bacterium]|jgi:phosphomannomutase/phosphoglucomutase
MNPNIFREYDIRGLVGQDLDENIVRLVGRAFGTRLIRKGKKKVVIGRDVRESSTPFARAIAEGLQSAGIDVYDTGVVPTPVLYYGIIKHQMDGGLMITGSHNPVEYNGIKICEGTLAIYGDSVTQLRDAIVDKDFEDGAGQLHDLEILEDYKAQIMGRFQFKKSFHVAVDTGNGVSGPLVMEVLTKTGHQVDGLYIEQDGTFPNHLPDPEVPKYMADLMAKVTTDKAAVGFGFDGDGDRLGVIDNNGVKVSADWLLALFARDLLERHPGGKVRFDVKCSDYLFEDVRNHGGEPIMGRTGHSILKSDMKEMDAIIGGELSGHIVYGREYFLIDDPLYCALKVLELMEKQESTAANLFDSFPTTFSTAEIKAGVPEDKKFKVVDELTQIFAKENEVITIDGARVVYDHGWGLVRASNTTANLTLRFEARSQEDLETIKADFLAKLGAFDFIDLTNLREICS